MSLNKATLFGLGAMHWLAAKLISHRLPAFIRQSLSGADGLPSSTRGAGAVGLWASLAVTTHGLIVRWTEGHSVALGIWLTFTASALGISAFTATKFWQTQSPPPDPHNPPSPQP